MEMWLHALLSVLVLLIWDPIWVYKVTKATNKLDHSQNRTPTGAMLLSIFVPFYWVFWQYTVANMLDEHAAKHGENADNGAIVLIFAFLLPFVNVFVIQHRLNREALWVYLLHYPLTRIFLRKPDPSSVRRQRLQHPRPGAGGSERRGGAGGKERHAHRQKLRVRHPLPGGRQRCEPAALPH